MPGRTHTVGFQLVYRLLIEFLAIHSSIPCANWDECAQDPAARLPNCDARRSSMKLALHAVSYAGVWEGQAVLPMEQILDKAAELGYQGIELVAKRPHASLLDMSRDRRAEV